MKTLIFNGSPRRHGDTASLLERLVPQLPGEVRIIRAYDDGVAPCVDCRYCWTRPGCSINDGMQRIYEDVRDCDSILIASPVYFSELTGRLLDVASRLQTFYCARAMRGEQPITKPKRGGVLLVGGGDGAPDRAHQTARMLLRLMNAKEIHPLVAFHDTNHRPAAEDAALLAQLDALAAFLRGE